MINSKDTFNSSELELPIEETKEVVCDKHGAYQQITRSLMGVPFRSRCPSCSKEKAEKEAAYQQKKEAQEKHMRWLSKIGDAGIPERFKTRTLETYFVNPDNAKQQRIYSFCNDYAANFESIRKTGKSFLMLGTVGTGKTHLSIGVALEIMRQGYSSVFSSASKMFRAIKDTYHKGSHQKESEVMAIYTQCDLLIIDEVGVQRGSEFETETFFNVINERYENMRPTIILSNLTIEEIKVFLGERVFDRLRENGGKAFLLDWASHRGSQNHD